MRLRYRAAAKLDILEAREWYGEHSSALEVRFANSLADIFSDNICCVVHHVNVITRSTN